MPIYLERHDSIISRMPIQFLKKRQRQYTYELGDNKPDEDTLKKIIYHVPLCISCMNEDGEIHSNLLSSYLQGECSISTSARKGRSQI
jgi:hypothetical protein